jgi:hypothetical protein
MRTSTLIVALAALLAGAPFSPASPLLQTHWDQRDEYAMFAPNQWRLGCWSTAFAQILYYHRLAPHGSNSYTCSNGTYVSADFDSYTFDWRRLVNRIDPGTPQASAEEVARYSFFTSVVIEKDFNTGDYMLSHSGRARALEDHYDCDTSVKELWWLYDIEDLKDDIAEEIDAARPLMLHMRNTSKSYHAVVIDDYRIVGSQFQVHVNMGWEGSHDGYYDIEGAIYTYDDTDYRKIVTIRPPDEWPIPGDANYDGRVDAADAAILADDWGTTGTNRDHGDLDGDGRVGPADAAILAANWGQTAAEASATTVPEPGTAALLMVGLLAGLSWRRRAHPGG